MDVDTLERPQAEASPSDTGDADESQTIGAPPPQSGEDSVPPQAVALNTRLFADLLDAVSAPMLELGWTSPQTPVLLRESGRSGSDDLWIIMPLHDPSLTKRAAGGGERVA